MEAILTNRIPRKKIQFDEPFWLYANILASWGSLRALYQWHKTDSSHKCFTVWLVCGITFIFPFSILMYHFKLNAVMCTLRTVLERIYGRRIPILLEKSHTKQIGVYRKGQFFLRENGFFKTTEFNDAIFIREHDLVNKCYASWRNSWQKLMPSSLYEVGCEWNHLATWSIVISLIIVKHYYLSARLFCPAKENIGVFTAFIMFDW